MASQIDARGQAWTIHTEVFEGPLDLLLYLVKREGIDLAKLDVRQVTDGYLAYLDRMRELTLSLAGDYLVMAATLVHLKSLELFPRLPAIEEEGEDPREALARQLREYDVIRRAAEHLDSRDRLGRDVFARKPEQQGADPGWAAGVDAFGLLDVYWSLLREENARTATVELGGVGVDFTGCCQAVLNALGGVGGRGELGQMLGGLKRRAERVVTFVAVLEMAKQAWISLSQDRHLGPVEMDQLGAVDAVDLGALTGWVEDGAAGA